jgi:hypothetical protein
MPTFNIPGNSNGWIDTGIHVQSGQWIRITATGWIGFAFGGWHRSPDGVDQHGQGRETANNSHPGPGLIKNSLLVHVGGHTLQAGSNVTLRAPAAGNLHLIANDDFRADNGGEWQVTLDAGALHQQLLVVTQGSIPANTRTLIETGLTNFADLVRRHSDGAVAIDFERAGHLDPDVDISELVPPRDPPDPNSGQRIAPYSATFHNLLLRRGVHPERCDGVFRIYPHPSGSPGGGYWTWSHTNALPPRIAYSAIPVDALPREPDGVHGVLLHEYLHQADARFNDAGFPNFYDPDTKPASPPMTNHQFYEQVMRRQTDGSPPPWGRLHGVFGRLR